MLKFITSGASKIRDKLVLKVLKSLLGPYVVGLDSRNFQFNLISGTVSLHDLELRKDALAFLELPIGVDRGVLGRVRLTMPWDDLKNKPILLEIDDLYLLARPLTAFKDTAGFADAAGAERRRQARKRRGLRAAVALHQRYLRQRFAQLGKRRKRKPRDKARLARHWTP